jgi:hypothetical protein
VILDTDPDRPMTRGERLWREMNTRCDREARAARRAQADALGALASAWECVDGEVSESELECQAPPRRAME